MPKITSIKGRVLYNSRGSKTIEVDIISDNQFLGRVCAPSGASVGKYEAVSFPNGNPEESLKILNDNAQKFIGLESSDLRTIHDTLKSLDESSNYSKIGGALAFAVTIASTESASKALDKPMFQTLSSESSFKFPFPLGNILGGGAHAGPGTPDIQEILICSTGSKSIRDAIETNLLVHKELRGILEKEDPSFTNGRGDEGGWAPKLDNEKALELAAKACENLGFTLGREVSLGVDFASSTQWNEEKQRYIYNRAGFENSPEEQIEFAANIIEKYKLIYAEDAVHEEAFADMAEITAKFPKTMITGDDLTVTNKNILEKAIGSKSCNAAILKVNQAGSLYDAMEFANLANQNNIKLVTSHRSGESTDSHISHIGLATKSKMLKVGVVGGERVAKLNELIRLSEHDLIRGMIEI
ncbi:MAG: enolase [Nitrosarchaeum sp.]|nr:enolase [Nitrosarchaeum sp.]MCV0399997.1 enolase [Nitrosarchaeum sp.]